MVVGSHGHRGLERLFLGSVAERVVAPRALPGVDRAAQGSLRRPAACPRSSRPARTAWSRAARASGAKLWCARHSERHYLPPHTLLLREQRHLLRGDHGLRVDARARRQVFDRLLPRATGVLARAPYADPPPQEHATPRRSSRSSRSIPSARTVTLYSCGPTVYSFAHIGNFRSFLIADLLRRVLERHGYAVRHVMNITDVGHMTEDHLADAERRGQARARPRASSGSDPYTVAAHFERAFVEDAKALRLQELPGRRGATIPRSIRAPRDHVPEMLAMIQALLERGYAYVDARGQVYFEVAKFPEYGALSGKVHRRARGRRARRGARREAGPARLRALEGRRQAPDAVGPARPDAAGPRATTSGSARSLPSGVDARIAPGFPGLAHRVLGDVARAPRRPSSTSTPAARTTSSPTTSARSRRATARAGRADAGARRRAVRALLGPRPPPARRRHAR